MMGLRPSNQGFEPEGCKGKGNQGKKEGITRKIPVEPQKYPKNIKTSL